MTQVWGHRGASGYAPENTLPAFELALEQGADGFELDVQLTRDDAVVCIHDETLERTTNGAGWVADHSLEQLQALDASMGNDRFFGARIPTLDQVFELVQGTDAVVNVELKNDRMRYAGLEERVLEIVEAQGVAGQVVLSSFNHYSLKRLQAVTDLPLGALYSDTLYRPWRYVTRLGVQAIHPVHRAVGAKLVARSHAAGLRVHTWTVDEPDDLRRMISLGVDAVITNYPDRARALAG